MAMVTVEHETRQEKVDVDKWLPGEHFVGLHRLDFWGLDRAARVEMLRVLQTLEEMDRSGVTFLMNRFRERTRLTFWCSCRLGARGQLSDDRKCHSDARAPRYLDLSS